jgi:carbon monoxide dehydrogenase subunit G
MLKTKRTANNQALIWTSSISLVVLIFVTSSGSGTPSITAVEEIKLSREILAPIDKVWDIVSDVDNETKYWTMIKAIRNINTTDDMIEREVTISFGPEGTKTHQFVTINPEQKSIQTNLTEGPITGNRVLTLNPALENDTTKIDVLWNIDLSGVPPFAQGFAKDNIMNTTAEALNRIAEEAVLEP